MIKMKNNKYYIFLFCLLYITGDKERTNINTLNKKYKKKPGYTISYTKNKNNALEDRINNLVTRPLVI